MKVTPIVIACIAAACLAAPAAAQRGLGQIEVGKPFPNIVFPSLDGEPASIEDYRGKKVLLHVFASW